MRRPLFVSNKDTPIGFRAQLHLILILSLIHLEVWVDLEFGGNIPSLGLKAPFTSLILELPNVGSGTNPKGQGEWTSRRLMETIGRAQGPPSPLLLQLKFPQGPCPSNLTQSLRLGPERKGEYL